MDVTALRADVPNSAHLATEDRLEELLQTFPLTGPAAPEQTREVAVTLETVVQAIHDHADPATSPNRDEELRARGHRRRLAGTTYHAAPARRYDLPRRDHRTTPSPR
jgi:hypothetical protein